MTFYDWFLSPECLYLMPCIRYHDLVYNPSTNFSLSFTKYLIGIKGIYLNLTVHPILIIFCQTSKDQKSLDLLAVLKNRKDKFG